MAGLFRETSQRGARLDAQSPGLLSGVGACSAWAASVRVSVHMCGECGTRWRGELSL